MALTTDSCATDWSSLFSWAYKTARLMLASHSTLDKACCRRWEAADSHTQHSQRERGRSTGYRQDTSLWNSNRASSCLAKASCTRSRYRVPPDAGTFLIGPAVKSNAFLRHWPDSTHSSQSAACPRAQGTAGKTRALTVGRATVRAHRNLLARIDDGAMLGLPPQMVVLHFAKVRQGRCVLIWRQQQPTACLANAGQASDDGLEVTLMEHLSQWPHTPSGIRM